MTAHPEILITVAALAPPIAFALLAARTTRSAGTPWTAEAIAFLWGAVVAATAASALNDWAAAWVAVRVGPEPAQRLVPWLVAPAIEETLKASGLAAIALVAPRALAGARAGLGLGALVGLGFAAVENVTYYTLAAVEGGYDGLWRALFLRGFVQGMNHAAFTATTGLALGWAALDGSPRRTVAAGLAGLAAAIAAHVLWNAAASEAISRLLCNAPSPDAACAAAPDGIDLFVRAPLLVLAAIGPVVLALALGLRRAGRAAR